jgi:hypothetical protein
VESELVLQANLVRTFEQPCAEHRVHFYRTAKDTPRDLFVHGLISSVSSASSVVVSVDKQAADRL